MSSLIDLLSQPWAILPDRLIEIQAIYEAHLRGDVADIPAIEARTGKTLKNEPQGYTLDNGVAIVPLQGVLAKRANMFMQISGGASHQMFARDVTVALNDTQAKAILIDADTPGGSADGTQLAAAAVRAARGVKPVAVLADGLLASAGVWIGVQADQVYAIDSGTQVGSVGVVVTHTDMSRALDAQGVKKTDIVAGRYKRAVSAYTPLTEEGRGVLQGSVDYLYGLFVDAVADARGTTAADVLERMADGRTFIGKQAIDAGLIDGIASREAVLEELRDRADAARRTTVAVPTRKGASAQSTPIEEKSGTPMTPEQLEKEHPTVAEHFRALGHAEGEAAGRLAGATAERERIQSVRSQAMPGHEQLIEQLAFDGKTTGPEAAVQVLGAERQLAAGRLAALKSDTPAALPAAHNDGTPQDGKPQADAKPTRQESLDQAQAMAVQIAEVQGKHAKLGRPITAAQAMALINKEQ